MRIRFHQSYIKWGVTVFLTLSACVVFFFALYRAEGLVRFFNVAGNIVMPFTYGLVFAYLLSPAYNLTVRKANMFFRKFPRIRGKALPLAKVIATTVSILSGIALITGLMMMMVPQLIASIKGIAISLPNNTDAFLIWLGKTFHLSDKTLAFIDERVIDTGIKWVMDKFVPNVEEVVAHVSTGVFGALIAIKNILIGIIICGYFLNSKEIFAAQSKKVLFAALPPVKARFVIEEVRFINRTFGGFINGKLIDSAIVGVLCFIGMSVLQLPYSLLISVIIGVTNIIPFFGPFIGAIPSAIIILLESPVQCLYFVIFILILQQLDGNFIGPKILGDSTGLPSFWVMFAILVGGGMFGFVGMIIGIPLFAVLYAYAGRYIRWRLRKKQLPDDTEEYKNMKPYEEAPPGRKRLRRTAAAGRGPETGKEAAPAEPDRKQGET